MDRPLNREALTSPPAGRGVVTDPKPPAASGDHKAAAARIVGIVLYNEDREAQVYGILREVAKEAQLRTYRRMMDLVHQYRHTDSLVGTLVEYGKDIEKEGPL